MKIKLSTLKMFFTIGLMGLALQACEPATETSSNATPQTATSSEAYVLTFKGEVASNLRVIHEAIVAKGDTVSVILKSQSPDVRMNITSSETSEVLFAGATADQPNKFITKIKKNDMLKVHIFLIGEAKSNGNSISYQLDIDRKPLTQN